MNSRLSVLVLALATAGWVGCSSASSLTEVEVSVTYNNQPVNGATVTFAFADDSQSTGSTGSDGKCEMLTKQRKGCPLGKVKVAITKFAGAGVADTSQLKPEDMIKMAQLGQSSSSAAPKNELPEKYADPAKSGLTAEIVAGGKDKNKLTFQLSD